MKADNKRIARTDEWPATAEERALARAMEAERIPPLPKGMATAIHLRVQAEEADRRRGRWAVLAMAASLALLVGTWGLRWRSGGASELAADMAERTGAAAEYAAAEAEWLNPFAEQFAALETSLAAFEELDFATEEDVFPSL